MSTVWTIHESARIVHWVGFWLYCLEFADKLTLKSEFIRKADDNEQFINEVRAAKDKFKTVAKYYGRGLFSEELLKWANLLFYI